MYQSIKNQPKRLGSFETLGQWGGGDVTAAISAVGNAVTGVVSAIGQTKVLTTQAKEARKIAITEAVEGTKKLGISVTGQTEQARIGVDKIKATYGSLTQLIFGAGIVLSIFILSGAFAYRTATKPKR